MVAVCVRYVFKVLFHIAVVGHITPQKKKPFICDLCVIIVLYMFFNFVIAFPDNFVILFDLVSLALYLFVQ
jgi:hypothetical protein